MAFGGPCIFRVVPGGGGNAWFWDASGPLRLIPSGQGMGTFLQGIGWPRIDIDQTALNELIQNFGQGPDFV